MGTDARGGRDVPSPLAGRGPGRGGGRRRLRPCLPAPRPGEPEIDENGVDLAQVREMLALTPDERLLVIQNLVDSVAEIRAPNAPRPLR